MLVEPFVALGQGLGVGIHLHRLGRGAGLAQQELVDAQVHFAANLERCFQQQIQRGSHCTAGGIFHRHHAIIDRAGLDIAEHFVDRSAGFGLCGMAEMLDGGSLAEGAFGTEISHSERFFQRQAGRHDFAEQARHGFAGQRAGIVFLDPAQHLGFAFGAVDQTAALECADGLSVHGAGIDELEHLVVDGVDGRAVLMQSCYPCRRSKSCMKSTSACTPCSGMAL